MGGHDQRTDLDLIAALNVGDASAFAALYERHRDFVARLAYRFTGDRDDALDVVQETFAYLLTKFPGFRLTSRLTTFLYPAVRNIALTMRRKRRLGTQSSNNALDEVPAHAMESTDLADLSAALSNIPAAHREVLLMRFVDDLSLEEISQALEIPLGTVKSRLHHAVQKLRDDPSARAYFEP